MYDFNICMTLIQQMYDFNICMTLIPESDNGR